MVVLEVVVRQTHAVESRRVPGELARDGSKDDSDFGVGHLDVRILVRIESGKFDQRQQCRLVQHEHLNVRRPDGETFETVPIETKSCFDH